MTYHLYPIPIDEVHLQSDSGPLRLDLQRAGPSTGLHRVQEHPQQAGTSK